MPFRQFASSFQPHQLELLGSAPDRFLKCVHVIVPVVTLLNICSRELPIFLWRVEAFQEAFFLLLARDVQKEFEDNRALPA